MTKLSEEVLDHMPKKTPGWAIGIVAIIVAIFSGVISSYVLSRDDIRQFLGWAETHHEAMDNRRFSEEDEVIGNIMKILNLKSQQILDLSRAVTSAQQNNFVLLQKVDVLEKDVEALKGNLGSCEKSLAECKGRK